MCSFGSAKQVAVGPLLAVSHGGWAECCSPSKPVALGVGPQVFGLHPGAETQASCSGSRYVLGEQLLFLPVFFSYFFQKGVADAGKCTGRSLPTSRTPGHSLPAWTTKAAGGRPGPKVTRTAQESAHSRGRDPTGRGPQAGRKTLLCRFWSPVFDSVTQYPLKSVNTVLYTYYCFL